MFRQTWQLSIEKKSLFWISTYRGDKKPLSLTKYEMEQCYVHLCSKQTKWVNVYWTKTRDQQEACKDLVHIFNFIIVFYELFSNEIIKDVS
jgi:hypothetical protein